jgi:Tol biopolymer transport system component
MRTHRLSSLAAAACLLAAGLVAPLAVTTPSAASFTGANGLLVFGRERVSGNHTQVDLYTSRPNGSHLVRLTKTGKQNEFGATWNAVGTQIAFWRTKAPFGPGSLWVMDADGGNAHRLTTGIDARDPSWSPDGTRLVFTNVTNNWNLWILDAADGGGRTRLTHGQGLDFEPTWEPAGTRVAFTRGFARGDPGNIWVIDLTSLVETQITRGAAYDHAPTFTPDSKHLYFERDLASTSAIYALAIDGFVTKRLTFGKHFDTSPAVSPDGRTIVFGTDRGTTLSDLWTMNVNGSNLQPRVTSKKLSEGDPDWQPLLPSRATA